MSLRRMVPFILINIVVSAVVVLLILTWWEGRQVEIAATVAAPAGDDATPVVDTTAAPAGDALATQPAAGETGDGPTIHVVAAGETLGAISQQYDVPLDDIVAANDIGNVNQLFVGQELVIPIGGLPTATPAPTATTAPAASPTPGATAAPIEEGEAIVEISEVVGVGELTQEAVSIVNTGTRPVALQGWELRDEEGHVYPFGQVTLFGDGAAILVHTEAGQNGPSDQYWGLEEAIWEPGETVSLSDAEGTVQDTYTVPE